MSIAPQRFVAAGLITGIAVLLTARSQRWTRLSAALAGGGAAAAIVVWRIVGNALGVNDDFVPLVSIGDAGCVIAGGLAPLVVALARSTERRRLIPALVGALAGFVINVGIL